MAFASVVLPETVREERVPTEVNDELTTDAPRVVAESTWALLIEKAPPVARLMLPEVRESPPPKVEVAVEVEMKFDAVSCAPKSPEPETENVAPGVVVPTPTFPFERTVKAVVVAPLVGSAKTERRERLESEEVAEMVRREAGEVVPMPK